MRWRHSRHEIIEGEIVEEQCSDEFMAIRLTNTVYGMATTWYPGEMLTIRRAFVHVMDPVNVGPETPRFQPPEPSDSEEGP